MGIAPSLDWIYPALGWPLAAAGVLWLISALFRDRSRGRRRCPGCWYDLSGTPGLLCPECGRAAASEKSLRRTRRRWRRASLALLVFGAGVGVTAIPGFRSGWQTLVPTAALALVAPPQDPSAFRTLSAMSLRGGNAIITGPGGVLTIGSTAPAPSLTIPETLTDEMWNRVSNPRIAAWLKRLFLRRYLEAHPRDWSSYVDLPDRWPIGAPIFTNVRTVPLYSGLSTTLRVRLDSGDRWITDPGHAFLDPAPRAMGQVPLVLELTSSAGVLHSETLSVPCLIQGDLSTFLDREDDDTINGRVRAALAPELVWPTSGEPFARVRDRSTLDPWPAITCGLAYTLELRLDNRTLATGAGASEWSRPVWKDWEDIPLTWSPGGLDAARAANDKLTFLVRGDPTATAKVYVKSPLGKLPSCWAGSFTVPATKTTP
jgi:hypothetical protein